MARFLIALSLLGLSACGWSNEAPVVIDGSSQASFEQTLREARSDLGPKDRLKFEAALTEFRAQMFAKADNREEYNRLVQQGMDGLTAPRIVEEFDKNAAKAKSDAADAIFDAKRLLTGGAR